MKFGSKTIAVVLLFVGLVLVNYLASSIPTRVDATSDSIYSLSAGTKAMLGKIEEPITRDGGRIRVGDSSWRIVGPELPAGTNVRVVAIEGTNLVVEPA